MEHLAAFISRNLYIFPGGYFLVLFIRNFFRKNYNEPEWRTFSFRGVSMKVDLSKQMGNAIYWRGAHDWAPVFAMEKIVNPGDTVMDIGANQGEYSLWAARKAGKNGHVYAYEPLSSMYSQLHHNIQLNPGFEKRITPVKLGLSDQQGRLKLYSHDRFNEGVNTLFPASENPGDFLEEIELGTLDLEVERLGIQKIDLIKIDVEGAEQMVLKGAMETLQKHKPILFLEFNEKAFQAAGYSSGDILSLLEQFQYQFYKIGLRGKITKLENNNIPEFCNIIARRG